MKIWVNISKKKKKDRVEGVELKIKAQTKDFPPTFSTASPLAEPSAPRRHERVAFAWRGGHGNATGS